MKIDAIWIQSAEGIIVQSNETIALTSSSAAEAKPINLEEQALQGPKTFNDVAITAALKNWKMFFIEILHLVTEFLAEWELVLKKLFSLSQSMMNRLKTI